MDQQPKQARSKKRIEVILETADNILLETGVDDITIANFLKTLQILIQANFPSSS